MRKLMGGDKHRDIAFQLLAQAKQTWLANVNLFDHHQIEVVRIQTPNTETTFPLLFQILIPLEPLHSFTLIYPTQRHRGMWRMHRGMLCTVSK